MEWLAVRYRNWTQVLRFLTWKSPRCTFCIALANKLPWLLEFLLTRQTIHQPSSIFFRTPAHASLRFDTLAMLFEFVVLPRVSSSAAQVFDEERRSTAIQGRGP